MKTLFLKFLCFRSSRCRVLFALAGFAAVQISARAEVIFCDDFEDAGTIENVSAIDSKLSWEAADNRPLLSVLGDTEGLNSGNALVVGNNLVFARIPATTLEVGSSLVLSMRFRSPEENVNAIAPLRIGLCESREDSPDKGDTVGYWLHTGPGPAKSGISMERNVESSIGGGNDGVGVGETFLLGYDWLKPHQLTLKIVRPSASVIEIHTKLDDGEEVIRTDAQASVTQFNLVAVRVANTPKSSVLIDQIQLELLRASKP
jgi:hypothetical protein